MSRPIAPKRVREDFAPNGKELRLYNGASRYRFYAHSKLCADSFKEDRAAGLIYGAIEPCMDWESSSIEYRFCAYCGVNNDLDGGIQA